TANFDRIHSQTTPEEDESSSDDDDERSDEREAISVSPARADQLISLNEQLLAWPQTIKPHAKLAQILRRRRDAMGEAGGIDWGHAEALAFATLIIDGTTIRLSGQDIERGTFSHRNSVLHDTETGEQYTPLANLSDARGKFEIYNSPLSETAVLGFEY